VTPILPTNTKNEGVTPILPLENRTRPSIATLVDDAEALEASFERVKKLDIQTVYPGHGKPFTMDEIG